MNAKVVIDWVKRHVFIVVFGAIVVAAPIVGWFIGSSLKQGVSDELEERKRDIEALASYENSTVQLKIPGREAITMKAVVNKPLLDRYEEIVGSLRKDADEVRAAALRHNSKNRDVLMPGVFPAPPASKRQTIHEEFHPKVLSAYEALLSSVRAGMPPPTNEVKDQLNTRSVTFIASVGGGKRSRNDLNADDRQRHDKEMLKGRLGICNDAARRISFYASPLSIGAPGMPRDIPSTGLGLDRMFEWNWNFWITEDVVRALAAANQGSPDVTRAPVKRIVSLRISPIGKAPGSTAGGASAVGGDGAAPAATPVDPKPEVPLTFTNAFTGRETNPFYDVREVALELIVATDALPRIADALAAQNFITITNVSMKPADPFAAARSGFIYGAEPISEVMLTLEVVQLREWTTLRMPEELKRRLGTSGIASAAPAGDAGGVVPTDTGDATAPPTTPGT